LAEYIPKRGDLIWVDFHPVAGSEQDLERPALVLSPEPFNAKFELALVAPITSKVRNHGFEVKVVDCRTDGVVLCQQARTIDFVARNVRFIETAPATVVDDALAKVGLLVR